MARCRRQARRQGALLHFGAHGIRWERDDLTLIFPANLPYSLRNFISHPERILRRTIPSIVGQRRIIDLRRPVHYRLSSGKTAWLPFPAEEEDTCAGYLARGAPGPGDVVVDVGAFCGEITLELAALVGPGGRVFALEPDPANFELLRRNLTHHRLSNVTCLPHALWNRTVDLAFSASGNLGSAVDGMLHPFPKGTRTVTVPALSPADLFARMGRLPDFIKMDIEGAELEVVTALAPLLAAAPHPVRLAIASYHQRDGRPTHELITPVLQAAGFHVETGNPEHLTTWAWRD